MSKFEAKNPKPESYESLSVSGALETDTELVIREDVQCPGNLQETIARLEAELNRKDTTIRELIRQNESVRRETQRYVRTNVRQIIVPLLETFAEADSEKGRRTLKLVKSQLEEIASPFVANLNKETLSLTPREIEVCNLIRSGYSSKEIARRLSVSVETVRTQRRSIRRKLGATSKKVNLYTLLNNLEF